MSRPAAAQRSPALPPSGQDVLGALASRLAAEPARHARFAERVHETLLHSVLSGQVEPGARLPSEPALAALFQVSRPVVRQALERLKQDGVVASVRGSGTYVREVADLPSGVAAAPSGADLARILHGMELRLVIEPEAAYLAALRRTPADLQRMAATVEAFERATARGEPTHAHDYGFHEAIAQATANPRLVEAMRTLEYDVSHAVRVWRHMGRMRPWVRMQDAGDEHQAMLGFIRVQDAEGARRAMRSHIEKARVRMMEIEPA